MSNIVSKGNRRLLKLTLRFSQKIAIIYLKKHS